MGPPDLQLVQSDPWQRVQSGHGSEAHQQDHRKRDEEISKFSDFVTSRFSGNDGLERLNGMKAADVQDRA